MAILPGISTLPFELFLTREDRLTNALRNKPAVALCVVAQRFFQLAAKRGFRERWYVKLRSVQVLRIDHLPVERRIERPRFRGTDQRRGVNIHRGQLHIGQETGAVVKDGAIIILTVVFQDCNVVQMAVIV